MVLLYQMMALMTKATQVIHSQQPQINQIKIIEIINNYRNRHLYLIVLMSHDNCKIITMLIIINKVVQRERISISQVMQKPLNQTKTQPWSNVQTCLKDARISRYQSTVWISMKNLNVILEWCNVILKGVGCDSPCFISCCRFINNSNAKVDQIGMMKKRCWETCLVRETFLRCLEQAMSSRTQNNNPSIKMIF